MTMRPVRFETLVEHHHDEIYSYLWRLLSSAAWGDDAVEAQDLTHDVFLRAYQAYGRLTRGSNHRAWLYKIATNCAITTLKRAERQTYNTGPLLDELHQDVADEGRSPEGQVLHNETLEMVQRRIATLPPKQQAAVVLRHVQGLEYAAIAQALDCSEDSARANVYQGLRSLRHALTDEPD